MLSIRKINPMLRAIGTMGVVAGLVGAVTFAAQTSNTVALGPNDITTGTASLQIAADTAGCAPEVADYGDVAPGFGIVPALTSSSSVTPVNFCLENNGDVPLAISGFLNTSVSSATASAYTDIAVSCSALGDAGPLSLNSWYATGATFGTLAPNGTDACTATLTLDPSYPGSGGETIPEFYLDFQGTQTSNP